MAATWTDVETGSFSDGYLDWLTLVRDRQNALAPVRPDLGTWYCPLFVRLTGADSTAERQRLLTAAAASDDALLMDPHEHSFLQARLDDPAHLQDLPDEYALYLPQNVDRAPYSSLFTILDEAVPVQMTQTPRLPMAYATTPAPSETKGAPIVAIMDDGIGFLNARFCRQASPGRLLTRFGAVWIQALEQHNPDANHALAGRVLGAADINQMLAFNSEADSYAALNADLFALTSRRATDFGASHGTHVLDQAAGAAPDDVDNPALNWPLLAVQMPGEAVEDTSGSYMEGYLVQGMRWILRQAHAIDPTAPVIINISMGILAGPKDGTRFAEYQIAREAANWEAATGQAVRVVWAFGNHYHRRLVADVTLEDTAQSLIWRVQPGDQTPSYMEIHPRGAVSTDLRVSLTTPDGVSSGALDIPVGQMRSLVQADGAPLARLYHVAARDFGSGVQSPSHYLLALAPSEGIKAQEPQIESGAWTVTLQADTETPVPVSLQIQRDDSLLGYNLQARQSYFDHAYAYKWSEARQDYSDLYEDLCPITHAGSFSAMASNTGRQVLSVGAAEGFSVTTSKPALYTAQGASWTVAGPTVSSIADISPFLSGIKGTGTLSGSTRFYNGTSIASGRITRALALSAHRIVANLSDPVSTQLDDFDLTLLDEATPVVSERLGGKVIAAPDQARDMQRVDFA